MVLVLMGVSRRASFIPLAEKTLIKPIHSTITWKWARKLINYWRVIDGFSLGDSSHDFPKYKFNVLFGFCSRGKPRFFAPNSRLPLKFVYKYTLLFGLVLALRNLLNSLRMCSYKFWKSRQLWYVQLVVNSLRWYDETSEMWNSEFLDVLKSRSGRENFFQRLVISLSIPLNLTTWFVSKTYSIFF